MIRVKVIVKGALASLCKNGDTERIVEVPEGATLADALEVCQLPATEVMGAVSGGHFRTLRDALRDGEVLELLPVISGG